jgi:hypothetical protein
MSGLVRTYGFIGLGGTNSSLSNSSGERAPDDRVLVLSGSPLAFDIEMAVFTVGTTNGTGATAPSVDVANNAVLADDADDALDDTGIDGFDGADWG